MPRFFFDTHDGEEASRDEVGTDLPDREAARVLAIASLPDMARDVLPDGDHRDFVTKVRDEAGQVVFTATLSLSAGWVDRGASATDA